MITQKEIREFDAVYHRNGVSGVGFHLCSFTYDGAKLSAVLFPERGYCAVFNAGVPLSRWRGDDFEPALRAAILLQDGTDAMKSHRQP